MNAPVCKISRSQTPTSQMAPTKLPAIPIATDLPSLIRSVNIIRDVLRSITTSLTVNNTRVAAGKLPRIPAKKDYLMSQYQADWYQVGRRTKEGYVYHKTKKGLDKSQRAYIDRIDRVEFRNVNRDNDQSFFWNYAKKLDGEEGDRGSFLFEEDFFERVVDVNWGVPLIQISMNDYDDFSPTLGLQSNAGLSDKHMSPASGTKIKRSDFGKKWNLVFPRIYVPDLGEFFDDNLIDMSYHPVTKKKKEDKKNFYPEVHVSSGGGQEKFSGSQVEARLQIYSSATVWTFVAGTPWEGSDFFYHTPNQLIADRKPIYDKTKVHPLGTHTDPKSWKFDHKGWLDNKDLGTYDPMRKGPDGGGEPGPEYIDSSINNIQHHTFITDMNWYRCDLSNSQTIIDVHSPASHVEYGLINTGAVSRVHAWGIMYDDASNDLECEVAICNAGGGVIASGPGGFLAQGAFATLSGVVGVALRLKHPLPVGGVAHAAGGISAVYPAT